MSPLKNESCSLCITSPPYLNNFGFAEMTRMELYFWRYASSWGEITERVRRRLIINTTTAPTDLKRNYIEFSKSLSENFCSFVQPLIEELKKQMQGRAGKKDYYRLVYPYFSQMQTVIQELRRVLRLGSSLHLVVADAALYGVHIHTKMFLAELMRENGFQVIEIENLRARGERWLLKKRQGATSLGEFHIHAVRCEKESTTLLGDKIIMQKEFDLALEPEESIEEEVSSLYIVASYAMDHSDKLEGEK